MADNPAADLYDLLMDWAVTPPNTSPTKHRAAGSGGDWLAAHLAAVHLLERVREHVDQLEDVHGVLLIKENGALDRIAKTVFLTGDIMDAPNGNERRHLDPADLTALQMVAVTWSQNPPLTQATGAGLIELVTDARTLVHAADGLDDETRQYLLSVIAGLETAIYSVPRDGDAPVRRLAAQLIGSLSAYLGEGDSPQAEQTKSVVTRGLGWLRQMTVDKAPAAFFGAIGSGVGQAAIEAAKNAM